MDEDQDSLFGSPPPCPTRGRSPSQETFTAGERGPVLVVPSTGVSRKNVGTIALPGSHMSCAELPANLPASGLSLPRPTSSHDSLGIVSPSVSGTPISVHTSVTASRSSTRSVPSRASSTTNNVRSASTSTRKRRTSKAKSATPAPSAPSITLPGPNEPTPPNLLRSQTSLLGLAGLVGCVKPAQLYTHNPQPASVQQPRSQSPTRGSTPAHPIVIDDDRDTPRIGKHPPSQSQIPQRLDQLNPEALRSNIINSLTKEKNILPVLESLTKLLSGEPLLPANFPPQPFARPYGHGMFNVQTSAPVASLPAPGDPTTLSIPPQKRRKLKHVPAGAADWDIPFPFAAGEGPEAYRDTWAQVRAKQLITQLLDLVQKAAKRAAIKTAKSGRNAPGRRTGVQSPPSSRSASVETQVEQTNSIQPVPRGTPLHVVPGSEGTATGTPTDTLDHFLDSLEMPTMLAREPEGAIGGSAVPCDYSEFEEWLSQLQQFVPLDTNAPTPELDWETHSSEPLDSSASSAPNAVVAMQPDPLTSPHVTRDESIDPALLAMSERAGSVPQSQSPVSTSALALGDIIQGLNIPSTLPVLAHSPRTSLSSITEPHTPPEALPDVPMRTIAHQEPVHDPLPHPADNDVAKEHQSQSADQVQARGLSPSLMEPSEPRITAAQKGKGRADVAAASPAPSALSRSTSGAVSTTTSSKGALDKHAILERARERRKQLAAEIDRAKVEIWETSIENAVLVHFMRDGSL